MIDWNTKFARKVKKRLKNEQEIWLVTTGSDGSPQPRPVWFWWDGETFLIYSRTNAHKVKHLTNNKKAACISTQATPMRMSLSLPGLPHLTLMRLHRVNKKVTIKSTGTALKI